MQDSKKKLHVVDVPGHPRLRSTFDERVPDAGAVVFMLDSSTFAANKHDIAGCTLKPLQAQL